jgi:hypothetical protein
MPRPDWDQSDPTKADYILNKPDGIVCEKVGNVISVGDASTRIVQGLTLYGKTTQVTTTGKNLYSGGNLTFTQSKLITLKKPLPPGEYTLSAVVTSNDTNGVTSLVMFVGGSGSGNNANVLLRRGERASMGVTLKSEVSQVRFNAGPDYSKSEGDTATYHNIQIEAGSAATDYEPYSDGVPSPSPEYPQALETAGAGGSIGVNVAQKNLLDVFNENMNMARSGKEASTKTNKVADDGTVTIDASSATSYGNGFLKHLSKGQAVTISYDVVSIGNGNSVTLTIYDTNNYDVYMKRAYSYDTGKFSSTFTADVDSSYLFGWYVSSGKVPSGGKITNVQLELGSVATAYEPYKGQTLTASTPDGLPGIPVASGGNYTDENGQQWACDEIDFARGVYVQRVYSKVLDGTERWYKSSTQTSDVTSACATTYNGAAMQKNFALSKECLSAHFPYNGANKPGTLVKVNDKEFEVRIAWAFATVDELKAFLAEQYNAGNPVTIQYALLNPIETPLSAEELAQYAALHTNKPNTTVMNDAGAGMKLAYVADTKLYIDNKFNELAAAIVNNA